MPHAATLCLAALLAAAPGVCAPPAWPEAWPEDPIPNDRNPDKAREWERKAKVRVRNNFIAGQKDGKLRASLIDAYLNQNRPYPNLTAEHRLCGQMLYEWELAGKPAAKFGRAPPYSKADEDDVQLRADADLISHFQFVGQMLKTGFFQGNDPLYQAIRQRNDLRLQELKQKENDKETLASVDDELKDLTFGEGPPALKEQNDPGAA